MVDRLFSRSSLSLAQSLRSSALVIVVFREGEEKKDKWLKMIKIDCDKEEKRFKILVKSIKDKHIIESIVICRTCFLKSGDDCTWITKLNVRLCDDFNGKRSGSCSKLSCWFATKRTRCTTYDEAKRWMWKGKERKGKMEGKVAEMNRTLTFCSLFVWYYIWMADEKLARPDRRRPEDGWQKSEASKTVYRRNDKGAGTANTTKKKRRNNKNEFESKA